MHVGDTSGCVVLGQGIVIEFSEDTGLIKCSQNPQLFFRMSEVIIVKHKKLQLNEKVEFSVVPVSSILLLYCGVPCILYANKTKNFK